MANKLKHTTPEAERTYNITQQQKKVDVLIKNRFGNIVGVSLYKANKMVKNNEGFICDKEGNRVIVDNEGAIIGKENDDQGYLKEIKSLEDEVKALKLENLELKRKIGLLESKKK